MKIIILKKNKIKMKMKKQHIKKNKPQPISFAVWPSVKNGT